LALLALVVFSVCGLAAACTGATHKEIDAIGVVAAVDWTAAGGSGVYKISFDDGRTYEIEGGPATGGGPSASVGDLVMAGSKPDNWMLVAPLRVPDSSWHVPCYGLVENGDERDTTVELDFGVTLQKAPDFDEGGRNPKYSTRITGGVICLNRDGQVRKIY
jgi:hypothetical protein